MRSTSCLLVAVILSMVGSQSVQAAEPKAQVKGRVAKVDGPRAVIGVDAGGGSILPIRVGPDSPVILDGTRIGVSQLEQGQSISITYNPFTNTTIPSYPITASRGDVSFYQGKITALKVLKGVPTVFVGSGGHAYRFVLMGNSKITQGSDYTETNIMSLRVGDEVEAIIKTSGSIVERMNRLQMVSTLPSSPKRIPLSGAVLSSLDLSTISQYRSLYQYLRDHDTNFKATHTATMWEDLAAEEKEALIPLFVQTHKKLEEERLLAEKEEAEQQQFAKGVKELTYVFVLDWYGKVRKVSARDLMNGQGPSDTIRFDEALVSGLALMGRDAALESAIANLMPDTDAKYRSIANNIVRLYLDNKLTMKNLTEEQCKEWIRDKVNEMVDEFDDKTARDFTKFTLVMSDIHGRLKEAKKFLENQ